ncbi:LLM class flavin-dependent oxidoreductase [Lysobacter korlensis]|uniref:LLM class flavin-dependent oxidoreductase n=1 Tax=Lysobacter korlensis TaxID=553636 RepID=A0ABV6RWB0_9GAMM
MNRDRVGVVFGSLTPPETLIRSARLAEQLGIQELWFSEDCFFTGGFSGLTQLLASTERARAGLGLVSVLTRHPAVLAMETAGMARMYPGRVRIAVGLGNTHWLDQMGLTARRPLTTVLETFDALRDLLHGAELDKRTDAHRFARIGLEFLPEVQPELWIGAVNARALRAAGRADGVLLSALSGESYIFWAKQQIGTDAPRPPRITAYVLASIDDDEHVARNAVRDAVGFFLTAEAHSALVGQSRFETEVRSRVASLAPNERLAVEDEWLDEFAVAGTPAQVRNRLEGLLSAGADSVGLWLFPSGDHDRQLRRLAELSGGT